MAGRRTLVRILCSQPTGGKPTEVLDRLLEESGWRRSTSPPLARRLELSVGQRNDTAICEYGSSAYDASTCAELEACARSLSEALDTRCAWVVEDGSYSYQEWCSGSSSAAWDDGGTHRQLIAAGEVERPIDQPWLEAFVESHVVTEGGGVDVPRLLEEIIEARFGFRPAFRDAGGERPKPWGEQSRTYTHKVSPLRGGDAEANRRADEYFDGLAAELRKRGRVVVPGFGKFVFRRSLSGIGDVVFKQSRVLKRVVQEGRAPDISNDVLREAVTQTLESGDDVALGTRALLYQARIPELFGVDPRTSTPVRTPELRYVDVLVRLDEARPEDHVGSR